MLVEPNRFHLCSKLLFIDAPEEQRIERFAKRHNYTHEQATIQLRKREERQTPLQDKIKLCTIFYNAATVYDENKVELIAESLGL